MCFSWRKIGVRLYEVEADQGTFQRMAALCVLAQSSHPSCLAAGFGVGRMKSYVIVDITVEDMEGFMKYVERISPLISKHGGRYLVRGAEPEALLAEGERPQFIVVLEFPSRDAANAFFRERADRGLADLFSGATKSRILLADGVQDNV